MHNFLNWNIQDVENGTIELLLAKLSDRNVLLKVSKKTDPNRNSKVAFSVVRICDDPEVLARFCSSYVQSQVRKS